MNVNSKTLKSKIVKILKKKNDVQLTPKLIRNELEKDLGLPEGSLEPKKDVIRKIIKEEVDKINSRAENSPQKRKRNNTLKKPRNAYSYYSAEICKEIKAENPNISLGEAGKLAGKRWKELPDNIKQPYMDRANQDKLRYEKEKSLYEDQNPTKKAKKEVSSKAPSGYQLFCASRRQEIKLNNPTISFAETNKLLAEEWRNLDDTNKDKFQAESSMAKDTIKEEKKKNAPPPKNRSSYIIFTTLKREEVKNENPGIHVTEIMKRLSDKWKELTPDEKEYYNHMAELEKKEYQVKIKIWEAEHPDIIEAQKNEAYAMQLFIKLKKKENMELPQIKKIWKEMTKERKSKCIKSALEFRAIQEQKKKPQSRRNKKMEKVDEDREGEGEGDGDAEGEGEEEEGLEGDEAEGEEVEMEEENTRPSRRSDYSKAVKISRTDQVGSDGEYEFN